MISSVTMFTNNLNLFNRWDQIISANKSDIGQVVVNNPDGFVSDNINIETKHKVIDNHDENFVKRETFLLEQVIEILTGIVSSIESEYILLLDNDIVPEVGFIQKLFPLLSGDVKFACPLYAQCNWDDNLNGYYAMAGGFEMGDNYKIGTVFQNPFEIAWGGTGCLLGKTEHFKEILPFTIENINNVILNGYDYTLGVKAKELGYKIVCHPGIVCKHNKI